MGVNDWIWIWAIEWMDGQRNRTERNKVVLFIVGSLWRDGQVKINGGEWMRTHVDLYGSLWSDFLT